jgi:hypothetical protein
VTVPVLDSERRDLNGLGRAHALERGRGWFRRVESVSILA